MQHGLARRGEHPFANQIANQLRVTTRYGTSQDEMIVVKMPNQSAPPQSRNTAKRGLAAGRCLLWVISGHPDPFMSCRQYPRQRTFVGASGMSEKCHKRIS